MSVISVYRRHQMSPDELKLKIDSLRIDIENRFELYSEWETDQQLQFRRKGIKGSLVIDVEDFQLTLRLGMMYRSMSARIEKEIGAVVDKYMPLTE